MLKSILNLEGAQQLNKDEQKTINGGIGTIGIFCPSQDACEARCRPGDGGGAGNGQCAAVITNGRFCYVCISNWK